MNLTIGEILFLIFIAKQNSSISDIKEDLQRELNDIKSMHSEDLCTVEQQFGIREINKSGLEDTYSNEILKLTEERNTAQITSNILKDELGLAQQEYESLKELYDSLSFDVGQYKNEKVQLLSQISVLSEQSSNLKSSLRTRRNEVEGYKTKITHASKTIEDYTKKLIERSDRSSNASDSLKSELGDLSLDISSPMAKSNQMKKKSNALSEQVKILRSNLDEAKSELINLHQEHGLSTAVFDRLTNILNLLKNYLDTEILEQETECVDDGDQDLSDGHSPLKLVFEDALDFIEQKDKDKVKEHLNNENLCDEINQAKTFELSENLSLDDDELCASDNTCFTQQDFEKELRNLKIDIPLDYGNSTLKQNLNIESKEDSEEFQLVILNLRKENILLQQKIDVLENKINVPVASSHQADSDISSSLLHGFSCEIFVNEDSSAFSDGKLGSLKMLLENIAIFEGNDASGFKRCGKNTFAENVLNDFLNILDGLQEENNTLKEELQRISAANINSDFNSNDMTTRNDSASECSDPSGDTEQRIDVIQKLKMDNNALKQKILDFEKDIFNKHLNSDTVTSQQSSAILPMYTHEIFDDEFDSDTSSNSLAGQEITTDSKKNSPKQMDSEGHTLQQRDSLSKSFSDLEMENENLKRENVSLKEEAERDSKAIIGPGFTSEILYYEHAQPVDGDSVGIKVDAIKTLLSNVVISQGNEAVGFHEYEGRDVILRLLLDIQVEVVDLIKENHVLKEETVKQKPYAVSSCSVQTGDSILGEVAVDESSDSVIDEDKKPSVNICSVDDGPDTSSLREQDLLLSDNGNINIKQDELGDTQTEQESHMCSTILEEQTLSEDVDNYVANVPEIDNINTQSEDILLMEMPFIDEEKLKPEFTSTVKDIHDCEIVNLGEKNAHIMLKIKQKKKKVLLPGLSSIYFSADHAENISNMGVPSQIPFSKADTSIAEDDTDVNNALKNASKALVNEIITKAAEQHNLENEVIIQNQPVLVPGFSSEVLLSDSLPCTDGNVFNNKLSTIKMILENVIIFEGNENIGFQKKSKQNDITGEIFNDFEADVLKIQKENTTLKDQIEKEKNLRMGGLKIPDRIRRDSQDSLDESLDVEDLVDISTVYNQQDDSALNFQHTLASVVDFHGSLSSIDENEVYDMHRNNVSMVPGFSSDVLLQQQSITSAVDDALSMLMENIIIFEGNEDVGFKTSDGNDLTKSFMHDCQVQVTKLRKENAALKLQKEDLQETVEKQEFFTAPGVSNEMFNDNNSSSLSNITLRDLTSLLENIVISEGNESFGFTKSEEMDISRRLLNDFKGKIGGLISENDNLKGKVEKMQAICDSRVNNEVINIGIVQPTSSDLEMQDNAETVEKNLTSGKTWMLYDGENSAVNECQQQHEINNLREENQTLKKELEKQCSVLVPGFSSELILGEDVLPSSEVDTLTQKLDALKEVLESIVIFKGNQEIGYVKYNDVNLSLQLLNDFEIKAIEMITENLMMKKHLKVLSIPDFSSEVLLDTGKQINFVPHFSNETDKQENPILCDSLDAVTPQLEGVEIKLVPQNELSQEEFVQVIIHNILYLVIISLFCI